MDKQLTLRQSGEMEQTSYISVRRECTPYSLFPQGVELTTFLFSRSKPVEIVFEVVGNLLPHNAVTEAKPKQNI